MHNDQNIHIEDCKFIDNIGNRRDYLANMTIFNFLTFSHGGIAATYNQSSNATLDVIRCMFINNSARINVLNADDPRPRAYFPVGKGSGMFIRFSNHTNNTKMNLINNTFIENLAESNGGSIYISFIHDPRNNSVSISGCTFESSSSFAVGGAIAISVFEVQKNNTVIIEDTVFRNGNASFGGGGVSVILQDSLASTNLAASSNHSDYIVVMKNCTFENNLSPTGGSAVGLVSNARVDQTSSLSTLFINW